MRRDETVSGSTPVPPYASSAARPRCRSGSTARAEVRTWDDVSRAARARTRVNAPSGIAGACSAFELDVRWRTLEQIGQREGALSKEQAVEERREVQVEDQAVVDGE
jgi:hypothetical protein